MVNLSVALADAVVAALNSAPHSLGFLAKRTYRVSTDLKEDDGLMVSVQPKAILYVLQARDSLTVELQVEVGVLKKLSLATNSEIDALVLLVEELNQFLATYEFLEFDWIGAENVPIFSPQHLADLKQFTSILTLTFRAAVAI